MLSPISFSFIAAGAAVQLKGLLYRVQPARTGQSPNWDGRDNPIDAKSIGIPITEQSYWQDRYALCELVFENEKCERLVMNDAIASISRSKNIVSTQMVGMNGTIKEYINDGDFNVNIVVGVVAVKDGVIVDEYPEEGLRQLRKYFEESTALECYSKFLDIFGINRIVIKSFSVTQDTASNYQVVNITAVSDEDVSIYSTDY